MQAALREDDQFSAQRNSLVDVLPMTPQILGWVEAAAIGAGRDPGHGSAQRVSVAVAVESPALFHTMAATLPIPPSPHNPTWLLWRLRSEGGRKPTAGPVPVSPGPRCSWTDLTLSS
jgi:hypothetical protein